MDREPDKYFFHYTRRDAAFAGILPSGRLRLSTYGEMRDPLENQPWRFTFAGYGERDDATLATDLASYTEFEERANRSIRDCSHLLSLTIDADPTPGHAQEPFCRGWARARMWEQYAEDHQGVCLVFDRERLSQSIEESLVRREFMALYHRPVVYEDSRIRGRVVDWNSLKSEPGYFVRYIEQHVDSLFFTKTLDWETEQEYRFVAVSQTSTPPVEADFQDSLVAVIAGEQLPHWEYPGIVKACHDVGAEALLMRWRAWRPGVIALPS
jgi:hypothetical protein